ncbi:MAG: hypothetical protein P0119_09085 [Nitrospira sp.]|nr:hypothetical protein [Nitrospira sp.]
MGEATRKALAGQNGAIALDTFGGRIHVEWDPAAAVTPLGQLPFFIEFLKVSGLFEAWVADCPLTCHSNHASDKRAVLATTRLALAVDVLPGNETAPLHSMPGIWAWLDALPKEAHPAVLRGDVAFGNESVLREAEARPALSHQAAIDEEREGPHQDVVPLHRMGRGGTGLGRGRGQAEAVRLEPCTTRGGVAPGTHRRDADDWNGRRSGVVRLHRERGADQAVRVRRAGHLNPVRDPCPRPALSRSGRCRTHLRRAEESVGLG